MSTELPTTSARAWRVLCVTAADWGLPPPVQEGGRLLRRRAPPTVLSRRRRRGHERLHASSPCATAPVALGFWAGLAW